MPRGICSRHGPDTPCSCGMGNLYRFVEPVALYLLKARGRFHGYDLAGALNDNALTDSRIEPGALYRTLRCLEESGLVVSAWDVSGAGPARRMYDLTPSGEEHLSESLVVLERMSRSLSRFVADMKCVTVKNDCPAFLAGVWGYGVWNRCLSALLRKIRIQERVTIQHKKLLTKRLSCPSAFVGHPWLSNQFRIQIIPTRVALLDKPDFPSPVPFRRRY